MKRLIAILIWFSMPMSSWAGSWGTGSFENDDALDWVSSCTGKNGMACISNALQAACSDSFIEAPEASAAVAAAELVAAVRDNNQATLPPELSTWLKKQDRLKIQALVPVASLALTRIVDSKVSELAALWARDANSNWGIRVKALAGRLSSPTTQSTRTR